MIRDAPAACRPPSPRLRPARRRRRLLAGACLALFAAASPAGAGLRYGVVWYTDAPQSVIDLAASRYSLGVSGLDFPAEKAAMKAANPDFQWFVYNSGTDCYVPPYSTGEYEQFVSRAAARGWDPEEVFLHYIDDTKVVLQGDTLLVPGWGAGGAVDPAQARIPVYAKNLSRRLVNFSTPHAAVLNREVVTDIAFGTPFQNTTVYPDGVFLDNSAAVLYNYGLVLSGGHVREAPGNPAIFSPEFQDWQWTKNLGPFLASLRDTLATAASWSPDGQRKYLMINIADIWDDSYASMDVADVLFMEFLYNPVRNFGVTAVDEARRRDTLAAGAGISCFYAATMTRSLNGYSFSYGETLAGNLAWYLISRTENTIFFEFANATPNVAGWDTLTWRGVIDVVDDQFGDPVGDPFTLSQGVDPLGNPYAVKAREYQGGMAVLRNRGRWDEGIEPATAVPVPLPRALLPVSPSGDTGPPVEEITLRNGQAAILLKPTVPVTLLAFTAGWEAEGAVVRWDVDTESSIGTFRVYRENEKGQRLPVEGVVRTAPGRYRLTDPDAPALGARYWLAELTRSGNTAWHGPAMLPPASTAPAIPELAQNRPNPCRGSTVIAFTAAEEGPARLTVFDVAGREVARLFDGQAARGRNTVTWNGRSSAGTPAAPGVYIYRLITASGERSRKLILLP